MSAAACGQSKHEHDSVSKSHIHADGLPATRALIALCYSKCMKLYFLRHGAAVESEEWTGDDADRPLTADGRKALEREAKMFARLDLEPERIISSPLARAKETAEIIGERLDIRDRVIHDDRLADSFDLKRLSEVVKENADAECLMLVGHEPSLSHVIGELTGGTNVDLKKGGLARIDLADASSLSGDLVWLIPPKVLQA